MTGIENINTQKDNKIEFSELQNALNTGFFEKKDNIIQLSEDLSEQKNIDLKNSLEISLNTAVDDILTHEKFSQNDTKIIMLWSILLSDNDEEKKGQVEGIISEKKRTMIHTIGLNDFKKLSVEEKKAFYDMTTILKGGITEIDKNIYKNVDMDLFFIQSMYEEWENTKSKQLEEKIMKDVENIVKEYSLDPKQLGLVGGQYDFTPSEVAAIQFLAKTQGEEISIDGNRARVNVKIQEAWMQLPTMDKELYKKYPANGFDEKLWKTNIRIFREELKWLFSEKKDGSESMSFYFEEELKKLPNQTVQNEVLAIFGENIKKIRTFGKYYSKDQKDALKYYFSLLVSIQLETDSNKKNTLMIEADKKIKDIQDNVQEFVTKDKGFVLNAYKQKINIGEEKAILGFVEGTTKEDIEKMLEFIYTPGNEKYIESNYPEFKTHLYEAIVKENILYNTINSDNVSDPLGRSGLVDNEFMKKLSEQYSDLKNFNDNKRKEIKEQKEKEKLERRVGTITEISEECLAFLKNSCTDYEEYEWYFTQSKADIERIKTTNFNTEAMKGDYGIDWHLSTLIENIFFRTQSTGQLVEKVIYKILFKNGYVKETMGIDNYEFKDAVDAGVQKIYRILTSSGLNADEKKFDNRWESEEKAYSVKTEMSSIFHQWDENNELLFGKSTFGGGYTEEIKGNILDVMSPEDKKNYPTLSKGSQQIDAVVGELISDESMLDGTSSLATNLKEYNDLSISIKSATSTSAAGYMNVELSKRQDSILQYFSKKGIVMDVEGIKSLADNYVRLQEEILNNKEDTENKKKEAKEKALEKIKKEQEDVIKKWEGYKEVYATEGSQGMHEKEVGYAKLILEVMNKGQATIETEEGLKTLTQNDLVSDESIEESFKVQQALTLGYLLRGELTKVLIRSKSWKNDLIKIEKKPSNQRNNFEKQMYIMNDSLGGGSFWNFSDESLNSLSQTAETIIVQAILIAISGGIGSVVEAGLVRILAAIPNIGRNLALVTAMSRAGKGFVDVWKVSKIAAITGKAISVTGTIANGIVFHIVNTTGNGLYAGQSLDTIVDSLDPSPRQKIGPNGELKFDENGDPVMTIFGEEYLRSIGFISVMYFFNPITSRLNMKFDVKSATSMGKTMPLSTWTKVGNAFKAELSTLPGEIAGMIATEKTLDLLFDGEIHEITGESFLNTLTLIIGLRFAHRYMPPFNQIKASIDQKTFETGATKISDVDINKVISSMKDSPSSIFVNSKADKTDKTSFENDGKSWAFAIKGKGGIIFYDKLGKPVLGVSVENTKKGVETKSTVDPEIVGINEVTEKQTNQDVSQQEILENVDIESQNNDYVKFEVDRNGIQYGHGTNSSTLIGLVRDGGLLPTGQLIAEGKAPFAGELGMGIMSNGVNNNNVSIGYNGSYMDKVGRGSDVDYANKNFNKSPFNIEKTQQEIVKIKNEIEKITDDNVLLDYYKKNIQILENRLIMYKNLSVTEKGFVDDPFPMVIKLNPSIQDQEKAFVKSDVVEIAVKGKVDNENITYIYVPGDKVASVSEYLQQNNINVPVLPIESAGNRFYKKDSNNNVIEDMEKEMFLSEFSNNPPFEKRDASGRLDEQSVFHYNVDFLQNLGVMCKTTDLALGGNMSTTLFGYKGSNGEIEYVNLKNHPEVNKILSILRFAKKNALEGVSPLESAQFHVKLYGDITMEELNNKSYDEIENIYRSLGMEGDIRILSEKFEKTFMSEHGIDNLYRVDKSVIDQFVAARKIELEPVIKDSIIKKIHDIKEFVETSSSNVDEQQIIVEVEKTESKTSKSTPDSETAKKAETPSENKVEKVVDNKDVDKMGKLNTNSELTNELAQNNPAKYQEILIEKLSLNPIYSDILKAMEVKGVKIVVNPNLDTRGGYDKNTNTIEINPTRPNRNDGSVWGEGGYGKLEGDELTLAVVGHEMHHFLFENTLQQNRIGSFNMIKEGNKDYYGLYETVLTNIGKLYEDGKSLVYHTNTEAGIKTYRSNMKKNATGENELDAKGKPILDKELNDYLVAEENVIELSRLYSEGKLDEYLQYLVDTEQSILDKKGLQKITADKKAEIFDYIDLIVGESRENFNIKSKTAPEDVPNLEKPQGSVPKNTKPTEKVKTIEEIIAEFKEKKALLEKELTEVNKEDPNYSKIVQKYEERIKSLNEGFEYISNLKNNFGGKLEKINKELEKDPKNTKLLAEQKKYMQVQKILENGKILSKKMSVIETLRATINTLKFKVQLLFLQRENSKNELKKEEINKKIEELKNKINKLQEELKINELDLQTLFVETYAGIREMKGLTEQEMLDIGKVYNDYILKPIGFRTIDFSYTFGDKLIDENGNTIGINNKIEKAEVFSNKGIEGIDAKGLDNIKKTLYTISEKTSIEEVNDVVKNELEKLQNSGEKEMATKLWDAMKGKVDDGRLIPAEKAVIFESSLKMMIDYKLAYPEKVASDVFLLVEANQNKLMHQHVQDKSYLTGSSHNILHILIGNMQMAEIFMKNMGPMERVLTRQVIIDHDIGYTSMFNKYLQGSIKKGKYFNATSDHPIWSTVFIEENASWYKANFGEVGYNIIKNGILSHSTPKTTNLPSKKIENIDYKNNKELLIEKLAKDKTLLELFNSVNSTKFTQENIKDMTETQRRNYIMAERVFSVTSVVDGAAASGDLKTDFLFGQPVIAKQFMGVYDSMAEGNIEVSKANLLKIVDIIKNSEWDQSLKIATLDALDSMYLKPDASGKTPFETKLLELDNASPEKINSEKEEINKKVQEEVKKDEKKGKKYLDKILNDFNKVNKTEFTKIEELLGANDMQMKAYLKFDFINDIVSFPYKKYLAQYGVRMSKNENNEIKISQENGVVKIEFELAGETFESLVEMGGVEFALEGLIKVCNDFNVRKGDPQITDLIKNIEIAKNNSNKEVDGDFIKQLKALYEDASSITLVGANNEKIILNFEGKPYIGVEGYIEAQININESVNSEMINIENSFELLSQATSLDQKTVISDDIKLYITNISKSVGEKTIYLVDNKNLVEYCQEIQQKIDKYFLADGVVSENNINEIRMDVEKISDTGKFPQLFDAKIK